MNSSMLLMLVRLRSKIFSQDRETQEPEEPEDESAQARNEKAVVIKSSFKGYEDPVRERLKMDNDDRPKIGLWVSIERHPLVTNHAYHSLSRVF